MGSRSIRDDLLQYTQKERESEERSEGRDDGRSIDRINDDYLVRTLNDFAIRVV